jgi:hypothetical protein
MIPTIAEVTPHEKYAQAVLEQFSGLHQHMNKNLPENHTAVTFID